jgi:hypothetical protein
MASLFQLESVRSVTSRTESNNREVLERPDHRATLTAGEPFGGECLV